MGRWVAVGALAWGAELLLCFARGYDWYLRFTERALFALAALWWPCALWLCGVLLQRILSASPRARRIATRVSALVSVSFWLWVGVALTDGRRVRDLPARPFAVLAFVSVACGGVWACVRAVAWLRARSDRPRWIGAGLFAAFAIVAGAIDGWVLPRGYPAFHVALTLVALWLWGCSAQVVPSLPELARWDGRVVAACAACAVVGLVLLVTSPNAGFATERAAPWTGKWVRFASEARPSASALEAPRAGAPEPSARAVRRGVDLRDRDVLLITVDALRADVLGAYGGELGTPAMDALGKEGVVFERAYTPTPHTSYALASLLTAKPLREVMGLEGAAGDHVTLPDMLRRYGYRTAAFYPPAIFFVDGARFDTLSARGLGFEYQKRMYASARERVEQVARYLERASAGKPVFVWVHLFEPHEPYAAPGGEPASDSSPRDRYHAEVRYVDSAIGALVERFRRVRSDATVIVSADHGEEFGDHGGHYHGTTLYDEQVRVPLLWSSPGVVQPARTDAPVELIDIGTTLLAAAGIPRDARMRGDDLGEVLASRGPGPAFAFASVEDRYMVTDGHHKAICRMHAAHCQLYDLQADPPERDNLASRDDEVAPRLRAALTAHLGSIAHEEVAAMDDGEGWPEPLVRARLGSPGVGPDLVPLLSHARSEVRAAATRVLGEIRFEGARVALGRVMQAESDAQVAHEAAIACCVMGEADGCDAAVDALKFNQPDVARRAAAALARAGRNEGASVLIAWARDATAEEGERVEAIEQLAALGVRAAEPALIDLLEEVRLRIPVSKALGRVATRRGADALAQALRHERSPPARQAEAGALVRLGDRRAPRLIQRMLGTASSLPGGVGLLVQAGALASRASGAGVALGARSDALVGDWQCDEGEPEGSAGCIPGSGASLRLPGRGAPVGPVRVIFAVHAPEDGALAYGKLRREVVSGRRQIVFERASAPSTLPLRVEGPVRLQAVAVVAQRPDIAPPAPEPWKAKKSQEQAVRGEPTP